MGRLLRRAQRRMLRHPSNDKGEYGLLLFVGGLLVLTGFGLIGSASPVVLLAALSMVALSVAEMQPPQRYAVAVVLRMISLSLLLAASTTLFLGLIP